MRINHTLPVAILIALLSFSVEGVKIVRVLSQNVKFILAAGDPSIRAPVIVERLLAKDPLYDIIAFQEVFSTKADYLGMTLLVEGLAAVYPFHVKLQPNPIPRSKFYDSGLLIVSRYPIELVEFHEYGSSSGLDALSSKGMMIAAVNVTSSEDNSEQLPKLVFGNTHLQAGAEATRLKQISEASDAFKRAIASIPESINAVVLAAGDFNVNEQDQESYNFLMDTLSDQTRDLFREVAEESVVGATLGSRRIDYVFGLDKISGERMRGSYKVLEAGVDDFAMDGDLTDHKGAYAIIELSNETIIEDDEKASSAFQVVPISIFFLFSCITLLAFVF
mmetsp:Transcript_30635/g.45324  ORF Transcript_30635/g.45324 Transcript_30635/m.45324 type:complete len:334 (-) Transcript_30635:1217-2218(-)